MTIQAQAEKVRKVKRAEWNDHRSSNPADYSSRF